MRLTAAPTVHLTARPAVERERENRGLGLSFGLFFRSLVPLFPSNRVITSPCRHACERGRRESDCQAMIHPNDSVCSDVVQLDSDHVCRLQSRRRPPDRTAENDMTHECTVAAASVTRLSSSFWNPTHDSLIVSLLMCMHDASPACLAAQTPVCTDGSLSVSQSRGNAMASPSRMLLTKSAIQVVQ